MAIWGAERVDGTAIIGRSEMACQAKKPCFVLPVPGVDETGVLGQTPACSPFLRERFFASGDEAGEGSPGAYRGGIDAWCTSRDTNCSFVGPQNEET